MIGFYLTLIWGIFAFQMIDCTFFSARNNSDLRNLCWYLILFFLFVLDLSADIFVLSFVSAFVFLMYSVNVFWVSSQTESQICLQELFWCFPDQSVISLVYICLLGWYVLFTVSANIFLMRILLVSGWTELCGVTVSLVSSVGVFR